MQLPPVELSSIVSAWSIRHEYKNLKLILMFQ